MWLCFGENMFCGDLSLNWDGLISEEILLRGKEVHRTGAG